MLLSLGSPARSHPIESHPTPVTEPQWSEPQPSPQPWSAPIQLPPSGPAVAPVDPAAAQGWVLQTPTRRNPVVYPIPAPPPLPGERAYQSPLVPAAPLPIAPAGQPTYPAGQPTAPLRYPQPQPGNLNLSNAKIEVVSHIETFTDPTTQHQHYRLTGRLANQSPQAVHKIKVNYRIHDGLVVRDAGKFTINLSKPLQTAEYIEFNVPVAANGTLEIVFIDWKFADGTQGIRQ